MVIFFFLISVTVTQGPRAIVGDDIFVLELGSPDGMETVPVILIYNLNKKSHNALYKENI